MNKTLLLYGLLLFPIFAFAATTDPLRTASTINSVTVFLKGAEIHAATKPLTLKAGTQDIIIEDLPTDINDKTIQVSGVGDFTILSVQYKINHLRTAVQETHVKHLVDTFNLVGAEINVNNNSLATVQGLINILDANIKVSGGNADINPDVLVKILDLYRTKMGNLREEKRLLDEKAVKLNALLEHIRQQITPYQQESNTGEVTVTVSSKGIPNAVFKVNYLVNNAGWIPEYDIRCSNITQPLTLIYKARVYQNSNHSWDNVKLTLSTGNPSQPANYPLLLSSYLDFYVPVVNATGYGNGASNYSLSSNASPSSGSTIKWYANDTTELGDSVKASGFLDENSLSPSKSAASHTIVDQTSVSTEFQIDIPYNIPSDNEEHVVTVLEKVLKTNYHYYAAPKAEAMVYLVASVTEWNTLNLMPGKTNIFYEGTFVGQSDIDPNSTNDTLNLSLGQDKSIIVKRTAIKTLTGGTFSGDKVKRTFAFEIAIKNTKTNAVEFKLVDKVPVSRNKDIVVTDVESDGGRVNPVTGKVYWQLALKPGEEKKVVLTYTVKYPKGKMVSGLE